MLEGRKAQAALVVVALAAVSLEAYRRYRKKKAPFAPTFGVGDYEDEENCPYGCPSDMYCADKLLGCVPKRDGFRARVTNASLGDIRLASGARIISKDGLASDSLEPQLGGNLCPMNDL